MNTPIYDFIINYINKENIRLHMPGHKGKSLMGFEKFDVTEFDGADNLYSPSGIIMESEKNASELFGARTYYSTEGASLAIRTMLYLATAKARNSCERPLIVAGRNAHKSFISSAALIDFDIEWIYPKENKSYLSCNITAQELDSFITNLDRKPCAVYVTSPDYLGNVIDIKSIANACKKHDVMLLVDNAHGTYLKFLKDSLHPIDLGASMCCDSAHKTLPTLTGGAYLHLNESLVNYDTKQVKDAFSLFASSSPSYLILESLDLTNKFLSENFKEKLDQTITMVNELKKEFVDFGYTILNNEPLKLTLCPKNFGYTAIELNELLQKNNIVCEFYDQDYLVLMFTTSTSSNDIKKLKDVLFSIKRKTSVELFPPKISKPKKALNIRTAIFSPSERIKTNHALGRILASMSVSCPPAVPIIVSGEIIDENAIKCFNYYGITQLTVVKE